MAGVVGFVSGAGCKSEVWDAELASGWVGVGGCGGEDTASVGEEEDVVEA